MKQFMMSGANDKEIDMLLQHYPDDQRAGSPFDTGYESVFGMFLVLRVDLIKVEVDDHQVNSSASLLFKAISFSIAHVDCCCRTLLESKDRGDSVRL